MTTKTIYIKTIGSCNLNCSHCFTSGKNGVKDHFNPKETGDWVESFMSKYDDSTQYSLVIQGGEPFLVPVPVIREFTDRFKDRENVYITATSNLTFKLKGEHIEFIKDTLDSSIGTSWDPWIRWDNEKQVELWKHNLKLLKAEGVWIGVLVAVTDQLVNHSVDWFLDRMDELGIDSVSLERLTTDGNAERNPIIFPDNEAQDNWYLDLYLRYKERKPSYAIRTLDIIESKIKQGVVKTDTNCRDCEQNMATINSDGTISGCPNGAGTLLHAKVEDGVEEFLVSEGRLEQIARELTWGDGCIGCDVFDLCGGDCHRLPWQDGRCGGLKNTLRYISGRDKNRQLNIIARAK